MPSRAPERPAHLFVSSRSEAMKPYFAYVRVSTAKQEQGASLSAQREAIERYAALHGLRIGEWFEEVQTAAKAGRRVFGSMIRRLARGSAAGVILHKIDRGARNLRDWADLGEQIGRASCRGRVCQYV